MRGNSCGALFSAKRPQYAWIMDHGLWVMGWLSLAFLKVNNNAGATHGLSVAHGDL